MWKVSPGFLLLLNFCFSLLVNIQKKKKSVLLMACGHHCPMFVLLTDNTDIQLRNVYDFFFLI